VQWVSAVTGSSPLFGTRAADSHGFLFFYIGCEAGLTEEPKSNKRSGIVPQRLLGYFFFRRTA